MTSPCLLRATLTFALLTLAPSLGHSLIWEAIESVDAPVTEVSSTAGTCVVFGDGLWFAAYVKAGDVYVTTRNDDGWGDPEPLTTGAGNRTSPQLAFAAGVLHVIWESDESGHAEIYTRSWDGTAWSAESCLTCDATPSRAGVLAGDKISWDSTDYVLAVWEDGTVGSTQILGRVFHDGAWGSAEVVSDSPGNATEPSATTYDGPTFVVAWTDDRNGNTDIYTGFRDWGGTWGSGINRTAEGTGSYAHPTLHHEPCCLDVELQQAVVVYEHDDGGVFLEGITFEITNSTSEPFSINQIGDQYANLGGFAWLQGGSCGFFGGPISQYFLATTSRLPPGSRSHATEFTGGSGPQMTYHSAHGLDRMVVSAVEGNPDAGVMALWVEEVEGSPTLMSRLGRTRGGTDLGIIDHPPALVIDPEGVIANTLTLGDEYSGIPSGSGWDLGLIFDAPLVNELRFDEELPPFWETTDSEGQATFYMRGGGCSQAGDVDVRCGPVTEEFGLWNGVKSPDVDGNCIVELEDIEYMTAMLGTDDFCADLDGSGIVDTDDLSLAMTTYQDRCVTVGVGGPGAPSVPVARLLAVPNPTRGLAFLRVEVPVAQEATIVVVDVTGRLVREFGAVELAQGRTVVSWDTRDSGGRPVSAGEYFAIVQLADRRLTERLTVLR